MKPYIEMIAELQNCPVRKNRTGVDTLGKVFNHTEYETHYGATFNAVSHKALPCGSVNGELLCFIQGKTSAADFRAFNCRVWDANANQHGVVPNTWLSNPFRKGEDDVGDIYGKQWRRWEDVKLFECSAIRVIEGDQIIERRCAVSNLDERKEFLAVVEKERSLLEHYFKLGYALEGSYDKGDKHVLVMRREIDQLANVIKSLHNTPMNRRMIISAWNPGDMERMSLPPCHVLQHYLCTEIEDTQERVHAMYIAQWKKNLWNDPTATFTDAICNVLDTTTCDALSLGQQLTHEEADSIGAPKHRLDLVMFQRSADYVLGSPFNIASYDAMLNVVAHITNTVPGSLHYLTSDTHVYTNHLEAAAEIVERGPHPDNRAMLLIDPDIKTLQDLDNAKPESLRVHGYVHKGKLNSPTPMAI